MSTSSKEGEVLGAKRHQERMKSWWHQSKIMWDWKYVFYNHFLIFFLVGTKFESHFENLERSQETIAGCGKSCCLVACPQGLPRETPSPSLPFVSSRLQPYCTSSWPQTMPVFSLQGFDKTFSFSCRLVCLSVFSRSPRTRSVTRFQMKCCLHTFSFFHWELSYTPECFAFP